MVHDLVKQQSRKHLRSTLLQQTKYPHGPKLHSSDLWSQFIHRVWILFTIRNSVYGNQNKNPTLGSGTISVLVAEFLSILNIIWDDKLNNSFKGESWWWNPQELVFIHSWTLLLEAAGQNRIFSEKGEKCWSLPSKMLNLRNERQVDQGNTEKKRMYLEK